MAKTVGAYLVEMMSKAGVRNVYGIVGTPRIRSSMPYGAAKEN